MSRGKGSRFFSTANGFNNLIFIRNLLLFAAYTITGNLGLGLSAVSGFATYVWFPTGISLAAVLIYGENLWPAIFAGAFAVNLLHGAPPLVAFGIAVGNTLEAIIAAFLLKKTFFNKSLESHDDVIKLTFYGGLVSTLVAATIGVSALYLGGVIKTSVFASTWIAWWVGDMVSDLIVAPLILVWRKPRINFNLAGKQDVLTYSAALILTGIFVFLILGPHNRSGQNPPVVYLLFPILVWAALRFNQRITVTSVFFLSMLAVIGTTIGTGPFGQGVISEKLYFLQSFMGVMALTSMIMAAVVAEKRVFEKQKDNFITIASHELKTPITGVKGFVQLTQQLLQGKNLKKEAYYLKRVNDQLNRLTRIVDDLLDLSRAENKKLEFNAEKFHLNSLVSEIVEQFATTSKLKITLKSNHKVNVYADRGRIGQVLSNLVSNAIKYSSKGKIIVEISENHKFVQVSVKDSGIGIDPANNEKIFNLFYREDDGEASPSGFGIGLYLSKYIITKHKGEMWFTSKKRSGSTFYFTLPVFVD